MRREAVAPILAGLLLVALLLLAAPAGAADTPALSLQEVGTFDSPVFIAGDPADPNRIYVVEKDGHIVSSENGVRSTFLDIEGQVSNCSERGMLSMAFPPDYATTGLFYVYYNRSATPDPALEGDIQIDEFRAVDGVVDMSSQRHVLTIHHPSSCQHNGGQMQFGPDGFLYIGTGDGYTTPKNAQDTGSLLGKILRIWPRPGETTQYTIPDGNPFKGSTPGSDEIWSYGLRNPWRFSFDRLTGDLVIGDVGDANYEEIDYEPAPNGGQGDNFGWEPCEGLFTHVHNALSTTPCKLAGATAPVYTYPHTDGRCVITGGYVVRDQSLGDLYGRYLFGDLCTGQLSSAALSSPTTPASAVRTEPVDVETPSTFGEDACGRVYVAELGGPVYRLVRGTPAVCGTVDPGGGDEPPATCVGRTATVTGIGGKVDGTPADDVIVADAAAERIAGHGGDDIICAGDGDDTVSGGSGDDLLRGGPGNDRLSGNGGEDRCKGGPGRDRITGC